MAGENLQSAAAALDQLRSFRARESREVGLGPVVEEQKVQLETAHKHLAEIVDAWRCVVPNEMLETTGVLKYVRGRLTLTAADASVKFRLESWLRRGGQAMLTGCASVTIYRIAVKLETPDREDS